MASALIFRRSFICVTGLTAMLTACNGSTGPEQSQPDVVNSLPRALTADEQSAIRASNGFGLELLREVAEGKPGTNVVLSPFSASVALGMAYAGANGTTEDAMRSTLGWGAHSRSAILNAYRELPQLLLTMDRQVDIRNANAMWVRNEFPVKSSYVADMRQMFDADVRNSDFSAATVTEMNDWASRNTNGKIPKVVEDLDDGMVVMLMNALYFKASWRDKFDASMTRPAPFTTSDGSRPSVPTMFRESRMAYANRLGAQWAELPYGNTAFVMTLVLPDPGTSPREWLAGVDAAAFEAALPKDSTRLELSLPKFRIAAGHQLARPLTEMGMGIAFRESEADFSRIADASLLISHVKQDVFIDVNEEGTEAAAVTQVGIVVTSAPLTIAMNIDRPFLFFIRERLSGTVLFAGIIERPEI